MIEIVTRVCEMMLYLCGPSFGIIMDRKTICHQSTKLTSFLPALVCHQLIVDCLLHVNVCCSGPVVGRWWSLEADHLQMSLDAICRQNDRNVYSRFYFTSWTSITDVSHMRPVLMGTCCPFASSILH